MGFVLTSKYGLVDGWGAINGGGEGENPLHSAHVWLQECLSTTVVGGWEY